MVGVWMGKGMVVRCCERCRLVWCGVHRLTFVGELGGGTEMGGMGRGEG